jgi:endonuclease G
MAFPAQAREEAMRLPREIVTSSERRVRLERLGAQAVRQRASGEAEAVRAPLGAGVKRLEVDPPQLSSEALRNKASALRSFGLEPSTTELERMIGTNDLVDEFYLERALLAARPVCRLVARNASGHERGYATGFKVSPRLVLTNWHVFRTLSEADNGLAEFDYKLDIRGNPAPYYRFALLPNRFYYSNQELDYCLVAVDTQSLEGTMELHQFGHHPLSPNPDKIEEGQWITIIQHPGGQRRQFAIRENQLVDQQDQFLWYRSDTAQGSSGAPAFNDSFQVVALHHSGKARKDGQKYVLKDGRRVDSIEDVDDSDVIWEANEGVRISRLCEHMRQNLPTGNEFVSELHGSMRASGVMSEVLGGPQASAGPEPRGTAAARVTSGGTEVVLPVRIHVSLTCGPTATEAGRRAGELPAGEPASATMALEKYVQPPVDPDYDNRRGYDPSFLGTKVPMPTVTKSGVVAKMEDGSQEIPYEHFSVLLHKTRRLAICTASNVDGAPKSRRPEPGDYTRKGLTGLGPNDREKWVTDPRIPAKHQTPDVFYTKDGGAFDKGHIVRREDVCWGKTRDQIVRANSDTFHTTNCSPQVAEFNQSGKGGIWGRLENEVLSQVKGTRYSVFAGPLLSDEDRIFEGKSESGILKLQIPSRYWKVVLAEDNGKLEAFAFLLEQDLADVTLERFEPDQNWVAQMISISELEEKLGIVKFPDVVRDADQHDQAPGEELMRAAEISRYRSK